MKLVLIFGPQAVGKMTVGQELAKITELKLFHNHMTIDLISNFFDYGTETGQKLVHSFRFQIFEEVAKSNLEGLIFTFTWCFELQEDWHYTEKIFNLFKENNADIYLVELEADLQERLRRNKTNNRLENKITKRDIKLSEKRLLDGESKHRYNSYPNELKENNYLRINNTNIPAPKVAEMIKEKFNL